MKELSIEEKARRYNEAIKRLEDINTGKCKATFIFTEGLFEYIFPELRESEDEKMMNQLHSWMKEFGGAEEYTEKVYQWIKRLLEKHKEELDKAYECADKVQYRRGYEDAKKEIEKQGEQKPVDKIEQEYHCTGVREPKEATGVLKQLLNKENYAWSEEDKVKINRIVAFLENLNLKYLNIIDDNNTFKKDVDWLKSLKERYTWKPSDEQMDALETAVSSLQSTALESLYNKLKKL